MAQGRNKRSAAVYGAAFVRQVFDRIADGKGFPSTDEMRSFRDVASTIAALADPSDPARVPMTSAGFVKLDPGSPITSLVYEDAEGMVRLHSVTGQEFKLHRAEAMALLEWLIRLEGNG